MLNLSVINYSNYHPIEIFVTAELQVIIRAMPTPATALTVDSLWENSQSTYQNSYNCTQSVITKPYDCELLIATFKSHKDNN